MIRKFAVALAVAALFSPIHAEEGMWTLDNLPLKAIKEKYGFEPGKEWLDHVRLSSLRFPGGSGSFVSGEGLVLTNHHVVRGAIQRLSTRDRDLLRDGFVAESKDQEIKIPGMELLTLKRMENITERVARAREAAGDDQQAAMRAVSQETSKAQEELRQATGLRVDPVTLYHGGETWLYAYERHTDVRLVMAPEFAAARFGQDIDNFTYPRHHMDCAFVRVYKDDKPYKPERYLSWAKRPLKSGDLVFVPGHPGTTNRLWTMAQMLNAREIDIPLQIKLNENRRNALEAFANSSFEARAQFGGQIYGIDNSLKTTRGGLEALFDAEAMERLKKAEGELQKAVAARPDLRREAGNSWQAIEDALKISKSTAVERAYVGARGSELLATALSLVRYSVETAKDESQRPPEYSGAALGQTAERLARPRTAPFNPEYEIHMFTEALREARQALGALGSDSHPFIKAALDGLDAQDPAEAAKKAVNGSKLHDPEEIKRLLGDSANISASQDPFIVMARKIEPLQRALRERQEKEVDAVVRDHAARIARARFAVYGKETYPDATFTLRLTYGTVAPYPAMGTMVQPFTTMHGLFDRFEGWGGTTFNLERDTWLLPQKWLDSKPRLNLATPYNFVSTTDIIGGNSGSPVIDRYGELVGLAFDGNWEGNAGRFYYDGRANRTVSVDARGILEMLEKVYGAKALLDELYSAST